MSQVDSIPRVTPFAERERARPSRPPARRTRRLTAAVVVCAYTMNRFEDLEGTIRSIGLQVRSPEQVILVIDHDEVLLARARAAFPDVTVIENESGRGLSGARNAGVLAADADAVAFLDDDVIADPRWLMEGMRPLEALENTDVVGVGCRIEPVWDEGRPAWFPSEFLWVVGCDYLGLPERGDIRNPIGAAMIVRRDAIVAVGGFGIGVGRTAKTLDGCEETELAIRIRQSHPAARFVREPSAVVFHRVTPNRHSVRYFVRRCFSEGRSKRRLAGRVGADSALSAERGHAIRLLLGGVPRELTGIVRGELSGPVRAGALIVGLGATTLGYVAASTAEV